MAILQVSCPHCGKENYVSDKLDQCSCSNCGQIYQVSSSQIAPTFNVGQQAAGQQYQSVGQNQSGGNQQTVVSNELLLNWKSAVGPAIGGAIVSVIIGSSSTNFGFMGVVLYTVYCIAALLYALIVYPSFFQKEPKLTSSAAVSFLNFMFGTVIFGALWNHNLTLKKKGVSNVVCAGVFGINIFLVVIYLFL